MIDFKNIPKLLNTDKNINPTPLLEKSLLNKPEDSLSATIYKVYVYGEYKNHIIPHFHFFDCQETFHVEIQIKDCDKEIKIINMVKTSRYLNNALKLLSGWVNQNSNRLKKFTNYELLIAMWDANNPDNEIIE